MLGRAGRPGRDKKGFGLILTGSKGETELAKETYFHITTDPDTDLEVLDPRHEPVQSKLWTSSAMTEQLLVALCESGEATLEQLESGFFGESYLLHSAIRDSRSPMRVLHLGAITAESAIEKHALQDTVRAARQGALGRVEIRERGEEVLGGIVDAQEGGHYTCRLSARQLPSGAIEGPMCSCIKPLDRDGLLCPHLVALGYAAAREARAHADYIIPLALSETSPLGTLIRLGLVEGAERGNIRPTRLGRLVNRLYLGIRTVRELVATMPVVDDSTGLMSLLRHIVSVETGMNLEESFEQMVGMVVTTKMPFRDIAKALDMSVGDVYAFLDTVAWILHGITAIADLTGLSRLHELSGLVLNRVNERTERREKTEDDID
jgi:replicative superfamily II helicase